MSDTDPALIADDDRGSTHWDGCWRAHHKCAIAYIERMDRPIYDAASYGGSFTCGRCGLSWPVTPGTSGSHVCLPARIDGQDLRGGGVGESAYSVKQAGDPCASPELHSDGEAGA